MKIITTYVCPSIPMRNFDWKAVDDDTYAGEGPVGWGATEREAIDDLMDLLEDSGDVAGDSYRAFSGRVADRPE